MEAEQQQNPGTETKSNVGGLIAEVENKMSELMAWHKTQVGQFETEKAQFEDEINLKREALKAESEEQAQALKEQAEQQAQAIASQRKTLDERLAKVEQQRIKLVELASKLRAQETAMSREWVEVQKEREAVQKQAADLAELREQTQARTKSWLEATAAELSEPLKLTTESDQAQAPQDSHEGEHQGEHHHAA